METANLLCPATICGDVDGFLGHCYYLQLQGTDQNSGLLVI